MEARRRLAVLNSHVGKFDLSPSIAANCVSSSNSGALASGDKEEEEEEESKDENKCVFCKIIRGESPAFKIYEDDICLCILDSNPLTHGHSLVIPKTHFPSLKATPPLVVASMCSKIPFVSNAIMKATNSDSFNLLVNSGAAAGQVIFHTHLHIIPRKAQDRLWKTESFRRQSLHLDRGGTNQLANSIREMLSTNENCEYGKATGTSSS